MPTIKGIAYFAYPVEEMAEARKFYEEVLGLKVTLNYQEKWVEYDIGEGTLAITTMVEGQTPGAPGGFVALEVDDLNAWVAELKQKHVTMVVEPFETPVCWMAEIADPDGNSITLHQRKPTQG
jgi:predicted enzyme related to lactoylglutathione lyase